MLDVLNKIDVGLFLFFNGANNSFFDFIFYWISDKWIWIPFYVFLAYKVFQLNPSHILWVIIFIALAITLSDQISSGLIKSHVMRLRPCHNPALEAKVHLVNNYCGGQYGFVSSHAANVFALATFLTVLLGGRYSFLKRVIWVWAFVVSYSRIYLGVHYPFDIAGGALVGIVSGLFSVSLYRKLIPKLPSFPKSKK